MSSSSLVIRNGTIVDGTGGDPVRGRCRHRDGRIAAIGEHHPQGARGDRRHAASSSRRASSTSTRTTTARSTWSDRLSPSSWNGVTTVRDGQLRRRLRALPAEDQHDMLINLMEGVEDIPEVVLTRRPAVELGELSGFLDAVAARRYDIDVARAGAARRRCASIVMGERGADREPATEQDRAAMAALAAEALRAGALGFSTSRTLNHRTLDGEHIPTLRAEEAELTAIAGAHARGRRRAGCRSSRTSRTRTSEIRPVPPPGRGIRPPGHHHAAAVRRPARGLARTAGARSTTANARRTARSPPRSAPRPTSVLLGLELSQNPFTRPRRATAHRAPAVRRTAGRSARPDVPRADPGRGVRGRPARPHDRPLGPHVPARRSAGLRTQRRETASPPGRRGEGRPPEELAYDADARGRRPRDRCICPSPTTPTAISTWCGR